ncbi:MAG: hypothetical protein KAX57_02585 [Rhodoferax sp.]|jgi:hypothetical protein|uniref:hypothetical protein n=1 Tax=Rhodoferax sp. TaxID=50421 RepID=UPI001B6E038E|nr:hypothetical protein [Rhodoferax sp.]MBP8285705.1 hypothetical protein [Rhodoferax sp.]MBP9150207.1 hypothetical protein [Rhodoferax sp.]MBP9734674.1 hypothetical protein [Rhodoferax sp.]
MAVLLTVANWSALAQSTGSGRVPKPVIEPARGGQCVEDPAFMRRNHMLLLKHQRVDTLRGGIRTGKYSLQGCIECHASQTTNSVSASETNFCQSCHSYAAVSLDCFGCHASKPASSAAQVAKTLAEPAVPQAKP